MRVIIILLLTALACFGRVGETREECEKRYGKPVLGVAVKNGISVRVTYWKERAAVVEFRPTKKKHFSEDQRKALLSANGGGQKWELLKATWDFEIYRTRDRKIAATLETSDGSLKIENLAAAKAIEEAEKAREADTTKGF